VADINDRLDRLQRREEFDRFGRPLRPAPAETPVGPPVARPAGVDDRLGEVLDAVAPVVRRHPGLSVMIALADGRAGRPVIRVTERDGGVETGVVVVGPGPQRAVEPTAQPAHALQTGGYGAYDGLSMPAAAPTRDSVPGSDPIFEPALRDSQPSRDDSLARDSLTSRDGPVARDGLSGEVLSGERLFRDGTSRDGLTPDGFPREDLAREAPSREGLSGEGLFRDGTSRDGLTRDGLPRGDLAREGLSGEGRSRDGLLREGPREGLSRDGLSREGESRDGMPAREDLQPGRGPARSAAADGRHAAAREQQSSAGRSGSSWHDALWSPESRDRFRQAEVDRQQTGEEHGPAAGAIPLPEDTSQVVSRLAQLLRDNPTLAANWSREAQE
jgi:hypothetical protein